MASYVVMEPPIGAGVKTFDGARIVKDGFAPLAFLFPPLWLAWRRLWLEAALALAAGLALAGAGEAMGLGDGGSALSLLLSVFIGLEGQKLYVAGLRRRGWSEWGVVDANSLDEAEIRYACAIAGTQNGLPPHPIRLNSGILPGRLAGPALGLLGYPVRT